METSWSDKTIEILRVIHPSLEQVLGKIDFPPTQENVESFIDKFANYGFHATDATAFWKFRDKGIETHSELGNLYFVADRWVSEQDIHYSFSNKKLPDIKQISATEYFERLGNSFNAGMDLVRGEYGINAIYILLAIDRNRAVPAEREEAIKTNKELREYRGAGFIYGHSILTFEHILDEGAVTKMGQIIPMSAVAGLFSPQLSEQGEFIRNKTNLIRQFYQVVVRDFLKNYQTK